MRAALEPMRALSSNSIWKRLCGQEEKSGRARRRRRLVNRRSLIADNGCSAVLATGEEKPRLLLL